MKLFQKVEFKIVLSIWIVMVVCVAAVSFLFNHYVHTVSKSVISRFAPIISDNVETKAKLYLGKYDTDSFTLFVRDYSKTIEEVSYIYYIDPEGKYAVSTDAGKNGAAFEGGLPGDAEPGAPKTITWVDDMNLEVAFPLMVALSEYLPEERQGSIIIGMSLAGLENRLSVIRTVVIGVFTLFAILIGLMVIFLVKRIVVYPIRALTRSIEGLSSSEGDLSKTLPVLSNDQIGTLSRAFNVFLGTLGNLVRDVQSSIRSTAEVGQTLAASAAEASEATEGIQSRTEGIRNQTVRLDGEILNSAGLVDRLKDMIRRIDELISAQTADITESSSAIQEMTASIGSISRTSEKKLDTVESLNTLAAEGGKVVEDTIATIKRVNNSTDFIKEAVQVIKGIAAQTDLLAMNAAIEAAHAGDAGKGFGVVAGEMRKLSEETTARSKEISRSLEEMAEYIRVSEVDSAKTGEFFHNIVRGIREVRDAISEIHNAMVELAAGGKEINTALASLIQISSNVNASSKEMMEGTQTISGSMTSLEAVSGETKSGMEDIMRRLESINRAMHLVSESGRKNAENVTLIEGLFSKFKV